MKKLLFVFSMFFFVALTMSFATGPPGKTQKNSVIMQKQINFQPAFVLVSDQTFVANLRINVEPEMQAKNFMSKEKEVKQSNLMEDRQGLVLKYPSNDNNNLNCNLEATLQNMTKIHPLIDIIKASPLLMNIVRNRQISLIYIEGRLRSDGGGELITLTY